MKRLPPLTKVRDLGGDEFEQLVNQLLFAYADKHRFEYDRKGGDGGVDGLARHGGVPGLKGPVAFQAKWLSGNLSKGGNATQIKDSLQTAANGAEPFNHYIIVTPEDITPEQKKWLLGLPEALGLRRNLKTRHWGHERLQALFRFRPDLLAECYPHNAQPGSTDASVKKLIPAYLNWLIEDCAPLKLRAIDQGAARSDRQPLGLASVYVDLELTLRIPKKKSLENYVIKPPRGSLWGRSR